MSKILFFGDSITSGENNQFRSFVNYIDISMDSINYGVSGTTIDDYSLYPVGKTDLMSLLYDNKDEIKKAKTICLEYGSNDASASCVDIITINQVCIAFNKAIDYIRQLNPEVKIIFIGLGENVPLFAKGQCDYLAKEYLINMPWISFSHMEYYWCINYKQLKSFAATRVDKVIDMPNLTGYIDIDGMHPNENGYKIIGKKIREELNNENIDYRFE